MPTRITQPMQKTLRRARKTFTKHLAPLCPIFTHGRPSGAVHTPNLLLPCGASLTLLTPSAPPRTLIEKKSSEFELDDLTTAVAQSPDGATAIHTLRSGRVDIIDIASSQVRRSMRPFRDRAVVSYVAFDASGAYAALATADGHVRIHDVRTGDVTHVYKLKEKILSAVAFHPIPSENALLLGLEDGGVMKCDLAKKRQEPKLWSRKHVASVYGFAFAGGGKIVITVSADKLLCITPWEDVVRAKLVSTGERLVAALVPAKWDKDVVFTVGEKGIVRKWDIATGREDLGGTLELPFVTPAQEDGNGEEQGDDENGENPVLPISMSNCGSEDLVIAMSDQTLLYISLSLERNSLSVREVVCGNLEEIYDTRVIEDLSKGVDNDVWEFGVASNSSVVWIMQVKPTTDEGTETAMNGLDSTEDKQIALTNSTGTWSTRVGLRGHSGIILCIDALTNAKGVGKGNLADAYLATSSRDKTVRVWRRSRRSGQWMCIGLAEGHTDAVGAVALSPRASAGQFFIVTGAADRTLKLWSLDQAQNASDKLERSSLEIDEPNDALDSPWGVENCMGKNSGGNISRLTAKWTILAHEKDINAVAVSPDCQIIATGSQDRTLKLWNAAKGVLGVTCKGHKRGIWNVAFSPVDRVIASCSGDMTIRVWNIANGECLRLYQGHVSGVLRCKFISGGTQIASTGADGLLKIWTTKSGECVRTYDAHDDRTWALDSIADGDILVSGGADGRIQMWRDVTKEEAEAESERKREEMVMEQQVQNAARANKWTAAVRGALKLGMTKKLHSVLMEMVENTPDREEELIKVVKEIKEKTTEEEGEEESWKRITRLMLCCRDWNAAGGPQNAGLAAYVLRAVFSVLSPAALTKNITMDSRPLVEALLVHCNRHMERLNRLQAQMSIIEHILERAEGLGDVEEEDMEMDEEAMLEKLSLKGLKARSEVEKETDGMERRKRRKREEVDMEY